MTEYAPIEGYAAIFNVADASGDVIAPGAFGEPEPGAVKLLYQHAVDRPIGRWLDLRQDAFGLYARGEVILSAAGGREAHALIEGGAIDGLSIGFRTVRARKEHGRRLILEAELWEISVVTFPMAAGARIARRGALQDAALAIRLAAAARNLAESPRRLSP